MLRNIQKTMFCSGFSGRYFSETDEKTMVFWCFWLLEDSWEAGGKDKSFSKTKKYIDFVRFLKNNDQENQKTIVFIGCLKRHAQKHLKNNGFSDFSGRYFSETL